MLELANNYTHQIPWHTITRLRLTFQANERVKLFAKTQYICDCTKLRVHSKTRLHRSRQNGGEFSSFRHIHRLTGEAFRKAAPSVNPAITRQS
jgi:hypothetical protein